MNGGKLVALGLVVCLGLLVATSFMSSPQEVGDVHASSFNTITLDVASTPAAAQVCTSPNPFSWSHTIGAGSGRVLFVVVASNDGTKNVASMTYAGAAMTLVTNTTDANVMDFWVYKLYAPATGSNSISVSATSGGHYNAWAASFLNVDPTPALGVQVTGVGAALLPFTRSDTITTTSSQYVVDFMRVGQENLAAQSPQTNISWQSYPACAGQQGASFRAATASSTTMAWAVSQQPGQSTSAATDHVMLAMTPTQSIGATAATRTSTSICWLTAGQWTNGTLSNVGVVSNSIQLSSGQASGTWTSNIQNITGTINGANFTYAGTDGSNYVSYVALLDGLGNTIYQDNVQLRGGGGWNMTVSSTSVTAFKARFTLSSTNSGTPSVASFCLQILGPKGALPPFDWLPYIIVALLLVAVVVVIVLWRYFA